MGCKIGKRTIISSPMQASDWNAVKFGNDCVISGFLQFHTFENMMLKLKLTDIRDGSAVNFGATVMGGAVIEPDSNLEPLCLVLKEMHLQAGTYEGSPADMVSGLNQAASTRNSTNSVRPQRMLSPVNQQLSGHVATRLFDCITRRCLIRSTTLIG